jgi:hypothetical protein
MRVGHRLDEAERIDTVGLGQRAVYVEDCQSHLPPASVLKNTPRRRPRPFKRDASILFDSPPSWAFNTETQRHG